MAAKSIAVGLAADDILARLRQHATDQGGSLETAPLQNGTRVRMTRGDAPMGLNVYPSKGGGAKIVFDRADSPEADAIAALLAGTPATPRKAKAASGAIEPVMAGAACWIGSDESGKGDYFGPLVVAAVALTAENWRVLAELGVQDSKNLTDARARSLAGEISQAFSHEVVTIMPPKYNELRRSMRNVNRVLAWAHARAIEEVSSRVPDAVAAVADQFGDEALIRDALFKRGRGLRLVQMPRAERDPAVAAASILARAEFLKRLDQLSRSVGVKLPKGASPAVEGVARTLVAARGRDALGQYAKLHFRTTQRVVGA